MYLSVYLYVGSIPHDSDSKFHISLSEWSFTICPMPYDRKEDVLSVSLKHLSLVHLSIHLPTYSYIQTSSICSPIYSAIHPSNSIFNHSSRQPVDGKSFLLSITDFNRSIHICVIFRLVDANAAQWYNRPIDSSQ